MLKTPMAAKVYVISLVFVLVLMMSTPVISGNKEAGDTCCTWGPEYECVDTCFCYNIDKWVGCGTCKKKGA